MKKLLVLLVGLISLSSCQKEDPYIGTYEGTYDIRINTRANGVLIDTTYFTSVELIKLTDGNYYFDFPHDMEMVGPSNSKRNPDGKIIFNQQRWLEDGEVTAVIYGGYPGVFDTITLPNNVSIHCQFEGYKQ